MAKRRRELIASFICLYTFCCIIYYLFSPYIIRIFSSDGFESSVELNDQYSVSYSHRKLLTDSISSHDSNVTEDPDKRPECTPPDIEQFPRPMMDYETRRKGGLVVHILVAMYMFLGLAVMCDEYFVPSLEVMCKVLNISSDVAGATFMAAGSSAPELATAVIAVFIAKDDIGIGTVVGSAVFNIAFVIGICGLFAGRVIYLNWWPMFRDCIFYLISILALLFALRDESVTWVESVLFLSLYIVYILFMFVNHRVEVWLNSLRCLSGFGAQAREPDTGITYHPLPDMPPGSLDSCNADKFQHSNNSDFLSQSEPSLPLTENEERGTVFSPPSGGFFRKSLWIASLPVMIVCYLTIPDCRRTRWEKWFFVTFLASCIWIGLLSYILVWMITIIGYTLHIKDTIMGLTFLAAGASIPDAISSLLVVRDGFGDMAVSNAVGSNVFDILLCLGLPWFVQTVIVDPGSKIPVHSKGLTYSTLTLLLTVLFLLVATHLNGWKLSKKYGAILLGWYGIFMVIAILYESNLFGIDALPICPSDF